MYKVGPVLSISHGMGVPSLSILLHEVIKLLDHAGAEDPVFFRIGTSGGIGLDGGNVVVTEEAVNGLLQPFHDNVWQDTGSRYERSDGMFTLQIVLGQVVHKPCHLDADVAKELLELGDKLDFQVVSGKTMCTNDFYEGQGRLDGAFCDFTEQDKMNYLRRLERNGVRNIEMEATAFAALTHAAGIRSAIVCVTLLDRLNGDQVQDE